MINGTGNFNFISEKLEGDNNVFPRVDTDGVST